MQAKGVIETAKIIANTTNAILTTVEGIKVIAVSYLPPVVKYPIKCAIFFAQIYVYIYYIIKIFFH